MDTEEASKSFISKFKKGSFVMKTMINFSLNELTIYKIGDNYTLKMCSNDQDPLLVHFKYKPQLNPNPKKEKKNRIFNNEQDSGYESCEDILQSFEKIIN